MNIFIVSFQVADFYREQCWVRALLEKSMELSGKSQSTVKVCRKAIDFWYGSDDIHAHNMLKWAVG